MKRKRIAMEDVYEMQRVREKLNKPMLSSIQWTLKGKDVDVDAKTVEEFELSGLNNCDFILSGFWRKHVQETPCK